MRVTYQMPINVALGGVTDRLCGRTLEEAFGLENPDWCQAVEQRSVGLKLKTSPTTPAVLASGLHKRVTGKSFDKTKFALEILTKSQAAWRVPSYIKDGLRWLNCEVRYESPATPDPTDAVPCVGEEGTGATE